MIKQIKLLALLVSVFTMQPVHASEKMSRVKDGAKKVANVAWHAGQVVCGCLMAEDLVRFVSHWISYPFVHKDLEDKLIVVGFPIGVVTLLNSGLRGLNRELKIVEFAKKLADRMSKKTTDDNLS